MSGGSTQAMGFTVEHLHHRRRRDALNPYFSHGNILRLEDRITKQVRKLCKRFEDSCVADTPVNLTVAYLALTMDIITTYALGRSSSLLDKEFSHQWKDTITAIMRSTALMNHFNWLQTLLDLLPTFIAKQLPQMSPIFELRKVVYSDHDPSDPLL